jgi:SNF2 family DNA or RNA helicase
MIRLRKKRRRREPLPHQRPVLAWASSRDRIALFIEMRLGKTFIATRWAIERLRPNDVALVVAPAPVLPVWRAELRADGIAAALLHGTSSAKRLQLEAALREGVRWFLINPEGLRAAPDLLDVNWRLAILDESTFIANPKNKITKLLMKRLQPPYRAILTGTPAPENDLMYFEQMRWLLGSFCGFKSYWSFRARCWHQAGFEWFPNRGVKEMLEKELAKYAYVLTAKDAGIPDERIYQTRYVELPMMLRRLYSRIGAEFAVGDLLTRWVPVASTWMAQVAGGCMPREFREHLGDVFSPHKFRELENLVTGELRGKPLVVFFRFNREIKIAAKRLRDFNLRVGVFTGLNTLEQKTQAVADFQAGQTDILLAQGRAARFGQNLSRASAAIFFSNWWDWQTRSQLEARIRHPDRKEPALYVDLVTSGTVDEAAVLALREKARNSTRLLERIRYIHESFR